MADIPLFLMIDTNKNIFVQKKIGMSTIHSNLFFYYHLFLTLVSIFIWRVPCSFFEIFSEKGLIGEVESITDLLD